MPQLFLTHLESQNQIDHIHASHSLIIIVLILALGVIFTIRRKPKADETLLSRDTGNTLRGLAIILLLFGHLAIKCIEGDLFFEYAGQWAVTIFLYISGVALAKTYGLEPLGKSFLWKRVKRLAFTVWLALGVYYSLHYFILHKTYTLTKLLANILGIITPSPPSEAAWFITYIIFLYLIYFITSHLKSPPFVKIAMLFSLSYLCTFLILHNEVLNSCFGIWTQYAFVFPASVFIGIYRTQIVQILAKLLNHRVFYSIIIIFLLYQYHSAIGLSTPIQLIDSSTCSQIMATVRPASLVAALAMISFLMDKIPYRSGMLNWLGVYSFEIFLMHLPFLLYYDFFLFRKPLYFFFFIYLTFIVIISMLLKRAAHEIPSLLSKLLLSDALGKAWTRHLSGIRGFER